MLSWLNQWIFVYYTVARPQPLTHNEKYIHIWKQCLKATRQVRVHKKKQMRRITLYGNQCSVQWCDDHDNTPIVKLTTNINSHVHFVCVTVNKIRFTVIFRESQRVTCPLGLCLIHTFSLNIVDQFSLCVNSRIWHISMSVNMCFCTTGVFGNRIIT